MENSPTTTTESTITIAKKRKSKKDDTSTDIRPDEVVGERNSKKRKKRDDAEETETARPTEKKKKKKNKFKHEGITSSDREPSAGGEEDLNGDNMIDEEKPELVKRKSKKEKLWEKQQAAAIARDHPSPANPPMTEVTGRPSTIQPTTEPAKKKRKNKTGFPDPDEDTSLPDQTRKALAYAFTQFYRPSKWKFHKARQNWLVRNVFSDELVPETYFPLTTAYLAKVQGGARENLLKQCRLLLEPPRVDDPPPETTLPDAPVVPIAPAPSPSDLVKLARAKSLINGLDASPANE